jgi:hypothetical protein
MLRTTGSLLVIFIIAVVVCGSRPSFADDATARLKAPDAATQADALKTVRDLFKADYAKKEAADRSALAVKLMKAADDASKDPASAYVLLHEARDVAASAGDVDIALGAIDALTSRFEVDGRALLVDTLTALGRQSHTPESAAAVANAALAAIVKAASVDDYQTVLRLSPVAESAATKAHSQGLNGRVQGRLKELKESHALFERAETAKQTLVKKPDDPEANTVLGKFLWLQKTDWPSAMPYLAKGQEGELKTLAKADLAVAANADAKVATARGDAWWKYAKSQAALTKISCERRAATWYRQAVATLGGLEQVLLQKRIQQVDADTASYSAEHGSGFGVDPVLAQAKRDSIEKADTIPMDDNPLKGAVTIPTNIVPYAQKGTLRITDAATITVLGGTEIRGGVIDLGGKGHLVALGGKGKPPIFRHVRFVQDLGASLKADGAIFDDCYFNKGGAWYSSYSSKWTFTSCVLDNCHFGGLTEVDYGFQLRNCALVSMDFPEIKHPHKGNFSHVTALHRDWNKITGCTFVDCKLPPTVCWCAEASNFFACQFISGEPFESDKPWQDIAYVTDTVGASPQTVWTGDMPKKAPVVLSNAPSPFATISLVGVDAFIPELVVGGDAGVSVVKSHLK